MTCQVGPGKFEGEGPETFLLWEMTMISSQDEETGDVDFGGWFGLFRGSIEVNLADTAEALAYGYRQSCINEAVDRLGQVAGAIVWTNSNGFVGATLYDRVEELEKAWEEVSSG